MDTEDSVLAHRNGDDGLENGGSGRDVSASDDHPGPMNRGHSHRFREGHHHHFDEHQSYDPASKVEFVPPVEGTPAALALAG